jgi:hypothetical protein
MQRDLTEIRERAAEIRRVASERPGADAAGRR